MQIPSFIFLIHLLSSISIGHGRSNIQRSKRKYSNVPLLSGSYNCLPGCATCSPLNGCLSCKPRFFFHLVLEGIRQRGVCLTSCPRGHYGVGICLCVSECPAGCELCVSRNACERCRADMYRLHGLCHHTCPGGFIPDLQLMRCNPQSERRVETRTQQVPHFLRVHADPCPHVSEVRNVGQSS
uniref:R-spondin Fu-CRD domain-containing protein n=1 Tax=Oryzias latipes TaxID=8090 RepID=A0A3P9JZI8_ORYLA